MYFTIELSHTKLLNKSLLSTRFIFTVAFFCSRAARAREVNLVLQEKVARTYVSSCRLAVFIVVIILVLQTLTHFFEEDTRVSEI